MNICNGLVRIMFVCALSIGASTVVELPSAHAQSSATVGSYLLPRGSAMRSPFTTQLDVRVAYGYPLSKKTKLEGFITVFNLMNEQEQLNVDENYTFDAVNPILGGDLADLRHVKTQDPATGMETNVTPAKNKNFGHTGSNTGLITTLQQAPRTVQLGFRLTF